MSRGTGILPVILGVLSIRQPFMPVIAGAAGLGVPSVYFTPLAAAFLAPTRLSNCVDPHLSRLIPTCHHATGSTQQVCGTGYRTGKPVPWSWRSGPWVDRPTINPRLGYRTTYVVPVSILGYRTTHVVPMSFISSGPWVDRPTINPRLGYRTTYVVPVSVLGYRTTHVVPMSVISTVSDHDSPPSHNSPALSNHPQNPPPSKFLKKKLLQNPFCRLFSGKAGSNPAKF